MGKIPVTTIPRVFEHAILLLSIMSAVVLLNIFSHSLLVHQLVNCKYLLFIHTTATCFLHFSRLQACISPNFLMFFQHLISLCLQFVSRIHISFFSGLGVPNCLSVLRQRSARSFILRGSFPSHIPSPLLYVRTSHPTHRASCSSSTRRELCASSRE